MHLPVGSHGVLMVREDTMAAAHCQSCHEAANPALQRAAEISRALGSELGHADQAVLTKMVQQRLCCLPGGIELLRCANSRILGILHLCRIDVLDHMATGPSSAVSSTPAARVWPQQARCPAEALCLAVSGGSCGA